jgi:hypothetical protein
VSYTTYTLSSGTLATAGSDYTVTSGALVFAPGVVSLTVPVLVAGDGTTELDESFGFSLSNPVGGATLGVAQVAVTILNDDSVVVSAVTMNVSKGAGAAASVLRATLTGTSDRVVTASFSTVDGTATAGSDYTATSGSFMWPPGWPPCRWPRSTTPSTS